MNRTLVACAIIVAALLTTAPAAHVTPVVVLRRQADVIRALLPGATSFFLTNATIGKTELRDIVERGRYRPKSDHVKFFSGRTAAGEVVGTVVFPQIDTQHGPIEVGVMLDPQGAIGRVIVTRASIELKPAILVLERSGALDRLRGVAGGATSGRLSAEANLGGMVGYVAEAITVGARRAVVLYQVLGGSEDGQPQS